MSFGLKIMGRERMIDFKDFQTNLGILMANAKEYGVPELKPNQQTKMDKLIYFSTLFFNNKQFIVEQDLIEQMLPSATQNKVYNRNFPFEQFTILNTVKIGNRIVRGIRALQVGTKTGTDTLSSKRFHAIVCESESIDLSSRYQVYWFELSGDSISENSERWTTEDNKFITELKVFICNFLDFLNNPDVELVSIERTKEQNIARINRNQIPIPSYSIVKVTGNLKIYLDNLKKCQSEIGFSHRFWVRGHFRTLRNAQKYKQKTGTKIWIRPFIKGRGELINKPYLLRGRFNA